MQTFIEKFPNFAITTDIVHFEGDDCIVRCTIIDPSTGDIQGTGLAHEVRGSTNINRTSHVENCETSAIGRALASLGLAGTEYASADEVVNAMSNQAVQEATEKLKAHMEAVKRNIGPIYNIKHAISEGELEMAVEVFYSDIHEDDMNLLWVAPTKGGIWTVEEYKVFKSNEWSAAKNSHFGVG